MKRLTLIRHAKSDQHQLGLSDKERPLNARGLANAPVMGQRLKQQFRQQGISCGQLFSSPANRALTTAQLIAKELGVTQESIKVKPALYTFDMNALYRFIEQIDNSIEHAVMVSHNPGITQLINDLTHSTIDNVPTCGIAQIQLNVEHWVETGRGSGQMLNFDYPKKNLAEGSG